MESFKSALPWIAVIAGLHNMAVGSSATYGHMAISGAILFSSAIIVFAMKKN